MEEGEKEEGEKEEGKKCFMHIDNFWSVTQSNNRKSAFVYPSFYCGMNPYKDEWTTKSGEEVWEKKNCADACNDFALLLGLPWIEMVNTIFVGFLSRGRASGLTVN